MINYLDKIVTFDQKKRYKNIRRILKNLNIGHYIQKSENNYIKNIIIPFGFTENKQKRFVISAHYDLFPDSSGANDNGAAVNVLLNLVEYLNSIDIKVPINILLTDKEECCGVGSKFYIETIGRDKIIANINLDVCGFGEIIVIELNNNVEKIVNPNGFKNIKFIDSLPFGDNHIFRDNEIPTLSICTIRNKYSNDINEGVLKIFETIHCNSKDNIDIVEEKTMKMVLEWSKKIIEKINKYDS